MSAIDAGPQCPSCNAPLDAATLRTGEMQCPFCRTEFEATPFQPRERRHEAVPVVTETPDGVAAACANHARNAAVTSCSRCGLFICALCDMNLGDGSFCPACFERVRAENTLAAGATRYRDYASMAVSTAVFSLICALPFGAFAIYWGVKGVRQRRAEGSGIAGPVIAIIIGALQSLALLVGVTLLIIGMVNG